MKHNNPYLRKNYKALFAFWQKNQIVTRKEFEAYAVNELRMTPTGAKASVGVILSPTESSDRGDCRGNLSARGGHLYFGERIKKSGEETKYRLRWRKDELETHRRVFVKKAKNVRKNSKARKAHKVVRKITKVAPKAKTVTSPVTATAENVTA